MYRQPNRIETTMQTVTMCAPSTEVLSTGSSSHPNLLHTSNTEAPHTSTRAPTSPNARDSTPQPHRDQDTQPPTCTPHLRLPPRLYRSASDFFRRSWSDADTATPLPKSHSSISLSTYSTGGGSDNANGYPTGSTYHKSPSWSPLSLCATLVPSSASLSRVSSATTIALYFREGGGGDPDDDDDYDDDDFDEFDEGLEELVAGEFPLAVAMWWGLVMMLMLVGVAIFLVGVVVVDLVGLLDEWVSRGVGVGG